MSSTKKKDNEIMNLLKVHEISRVICDTNMGTLKLRIRKGETVYKFVLDAVELDKETNNELMEILYPRKEEVIKSIIDPIVQVQPKVIEKVIKKSKTKKK